MRVATRYRMLPSQLAQAIADGKLNLQPGDGASVAAAESKYLPMLSVLQQECGYELLEVFLRSLLSHELAIVDGRVTPQLLQAVWTLRDTGQDAAAETLARILLERFNLSDAVCEQLKSLISRMSVPIVGTLESLIKQKLPFEVDYLSGKGNACQYTVRYAELGGFPGERHNYLKCWVEELNKKLEIMELAHNYSLNLNRIVNVNPVAQRSFLTHLSRYGRWLVLRVWCCVMSYKR